MGQPRPLFCLFSLFSNTNFTEKTVGVNGIRTRIVGIEGEHTDHLTTTTALLVVSVAKRFLKMGHLGLFLVHTRSSQAFFIKYKLETLSGFKPTMLK